MTGTDEKWQDYRTWHELLDAICIDQNHRGNLRLAAQLCADIGNQDEAAFESALRNLNNWRSGAHVPRRHNLLRLTRMLHIDRYDGLRAHWLKLYGEAGVSRSASGNEVGPDEPGQAAPAAPRRQPGRQTYRIAGMAAGAAVLLAGAAFFISTGSDIAAGDVAAGDVEDRDTVSLRVGESRVVHGARAKCGEAKPPSWQRVIMRLPETGIGIWSDGGTGMRESRKCGGPVVARGIVFTATARGTADISIYGDPVLITVE